MRRNPRAVYTFQAFIFIPRGILRLSVLMDRHFPLKGKNDVAQMILAKCRASEHCVVEKKSRRLN